MSDRQPAPANRAVFLSYASQDAEAVERIAAALRAAGVEVWFDKNELVGGDAWDAKIRGQIKSCALFVPVISAHTNARREGYFRREWKLAVDRTHDMDEALPCLVPVVIDGTTDAGAFVPEKFREVQWTRLPGGETPAKFCDRINALLRGDSAPARPRATAPTPPPATAAPPPSRAAGNPAWLKALVVALALGAFVLVAWWGLRPSPAAPALASAAQKSAPVAVTVISYITTDTSRQGLMATPGFIGQLAQIFIGAAVTKTFANVIKRETERNGSVHVVPEP